MALSSIDEILSLYDRPFIAAAYLALLGREIDNDGGRFYLDRLRSGVSREQVLWELIQSPEAQAFGAEPVGIEKFLGSMQRTLHPSLLRRMLPGREHARQLTRTEHLVGALWLQVERLTLMVNHCVVRSDQARLDLDDIRNGRWAVLPMPGESTGMGEGALRHQNAGLDYVTKLPAQGRGLFRRLRQGALGHQKADH